MLKKNCSFILGALVVLTLSTTTAVKASTPGTILSVSSIIQLQSKWCWATSIKCISDYLGGKRLTESQIVTDVKGSAVNEAGTTSEEIKGFSYDGVTSTAVIGTISESNVKTEINNKRPIFAGITWKGGGGHAEVIYGYSGDLIYFMDPSNASKNIIYYSNYCNNSSYSWTKTLYHNKLS